ncbi:MAG: outer membrane protein assembly factor BamE [Tateyamaria sp.]|jgi:outer membrane protein assembly factor BamE (lipoprotein component of BamABCDE complex)|nr:outer membrane protein assembly factor BamE [Tateyamaria sp.]MDG1183718.1 outer membrane protein assembly factor BamE [Tateyamaria sp.]MDG1336696.1 outer membrane protein assembly factor BamE [Tateyamaria sp.]MDG2057709.1 outer membrane protein assembly factor BamE [Tateyamaria sp.]
MRSYASVIILVASLALAGCSPTYRNHGYIPSDEDLQELAIGIDTRASVEDLVGPPSSGGLLEGGDYYYVRSRTKTFGIRAAKETERQVLVVSFDAAGVLQNVEQFGLEAGRVVRLSRRVTSSAVGNVSLIRQLLGNIGQFDAADALSRDG